VAEVRGLSKSELKKRIDVVVKTCGLEKVYNRPIEELSKGYRQRVGLAQAILHDPEILILDEPTTGLDPNQIIEIRNLIKELGKAKTVIFSTHILSEVSATCDRVVIINNGKIVGQGTPAEIAAKSGSREIVYVKIKGEQDKVLEKLKNLEGVEKVEVKDKESDNIIGYEITPIVNQDIREKLSKIVADSGWSILEISRHTVSLEDAFRNLTK
jgi:ABC-2 type transport system ATP-binding protein